MISHHVVPADEIFEGIKIGTVLLIGIEPLLHLAAGLRMLHTRKNVPYLLALKEDLEGVLCVALAVPFVWGKLWAMICVAPRPVS